MKIVDRETLINMPEGTVFCNYRPDIKEGEWHVKNSNNEFGATILTPHHGEIFNYDWNAKEDSEDQQYIVMDDIDIATTIFILTRNHKSQMYSDKNHIIFNEIIEHIKKSMLKLFTEEEYEEMLIDESYNGKQGKCQRNESSSSQFCACFG